MDDTIHDLIPTEILLQPSARLTKKTLGDRAFVSAAPNLLEQASHRDQETREFYCFQEKT